MNPYTFVISDNQLSTTSQGDLGAAYAVLKALEAGYSTGYGTHSAGAAYRYTLLNFPAGEVKKFAERLWSAKAVQA